MLQLASQFGAVNERLLVHGLVLHLEWNHLAIHNRVVLKWNWSLLRILHIDLLLLHSADPPRELEVIWHSG